MDTPKGARSPKTTEQSQKVKQAALELDHRIRELSAETQAESPTDRSNLLGWTFGLLGLLAVLSILGFILYIVGSALGSTLSIGSSMPTLLVGIIFFMFPALCKCYGVIVAGFTVFSGLKSAFSGQYFDVVPALPFAIVTLPLSYFCLGWGLLVASRSSHSKLGFFLGTANLCGGVLGLFQVKYSTSIVAPGYWGSALSGILTMGLGISMIKVILESWSTSAADESDL
jgi:hypothetical protein